MTVLLYTRPILESSKRRNHGEIIHPLPNWCSVYPGELIGHIFPATMDMLVCDQHLVTRDKPPHLLAPILNILLWGSELCQSLSKYSSSLTPPLLARL